MLTEARIIGAGETARGRSTRPTSPTQMSRTNEVQAQAIRDALPSAEAEYREMPGLSLTLEQAARLWGLDRSTCERVLTILIERRLLKRARNGMYVRR
jgi:hypothetical protein